MLFMTGNDPSILEDVILHQMVKKKSFCLVQIQDLKFLDPKSSTEITALGLSLSTYGILLPADTEF